MTITAIASVNDPCASRTLQPMKAFHYCDLPIVAVMPDRSVIMERSGQIHDFEWYAYHLATGMERHLVVTFASDSWLWKLHNKFAQDPYWVWQVMVQQKPRAKMRQHVSYYGFRPAEGKRREAFTNLVIDAGSFTNDVHADLIALGRWVRDFCNQHGIQMRSSAAGVAAQLLRHPMFYPEARRVVPRFINEKAREHLPGPFYESYADPAQRVTAAMYIDQETAYHYAAQTTPLPNANSIRMSGYTHTDGIYARAGGELYERELRKHGLVHAEATIPEIRPDRLRYLPREMRKPGRRKVWLWTNEIPYLKSFGLVIHHLISVWGTTQTDRQIKAYAQWARTEGKKDPRLKALLLMPYGTLGRRPEQIDIHSPGGKSDLLLAGRWIDGTRKRSVRSSTYTSNALQLGLIQAHVRCLSLDMARQLANQGKEVISVYADGIFIRLDDDNQLPMFAPWRLKEESLELHLSDSLRIPVRSAVRKKYVTTERVLA